MSQTNVPAGGGKKVKPPPPPPGPDPLSATRSTGSSPYPSANDAVAKEESFRIAKKFILNQRVNVNIEGCGWLLGTVVFLANTFQSLTGSPVRVRYTIPTERNEREGDFPNHPDHIRPL